MAFLAPVQIQSLKLKLWSLYESIYLRIDTQMIWPAGCVEPKNIPQRMGHAFLPLHLVNCWHIGNIRSNRKHGWESTNEIMWRETTASREEKSWRRHRFWTWTSISVNPKQSSHTVSVLSKKYGSSLKNISMCMCM